MFVAAYKITAILFSVLHILTLHHQLSIKLPISNKSHVSKKKSILSSSPLILKYRPFSVPYQAEPPYPFCFLS